MNNTIGVIIPVYNVEKELKRCLESVVHQSIPFDEVVIVEDGSTDNSRNICIEYENMYGYISCIYQGNHGLGYARNRGVEKISTDYVTFLDSDDYLKNDYVSVLKAYLEQKSYDLLIYEIIRECTNERTKQNMKHLLLRSKLCENSIFTGKDYINLTLDKCFYISACVQAYNRKFLLDSNIKFQEGIYYEDIAFCIKILLKAKQVRYLSNQLYVQVVRNNSIMQSVMTSKKLDDILYVANSVCEYICHNLDVVRGTIYEKLIWRYYDTWYWFTREGCFDAHILSNLDNVVHTIIDSMNWKGADTISTLHTKRNFALQLLNIAKDDIVLKDLVKNINQKYTELLLQKITRFRTIQEDVVGIYGYGDKAKKIVEVFKKYINSNAKFIYFITRVEKSEDELNIKLIDQVDEVNTIIISSFEYCDDMINKLVELDYKGMIINPYEEYSNISWECIL